MQFNKRKLQSSPQVTPVYVVERELFPKISRWAPGVYLAWPRCACNGYRFTDTQLGGADINSAVKDFEALSCFENTSSVKKVRSVFVYPSSPNSPRHSQGSESGNLNLIS